MPSKKKEADKNKLSARSSVEVQKMFVKVLSFHILEMTNDLAVALPRLTSVKLLLSFSVFSSFEMSTSKGSW